MPADPLHRAGNPQRSTTSQPPSGSGASAIEVRRSARRRRTVSAYREGDRTVVLIPARMSEAEEKRWVTVMLDKLAAQESKTKRVPGDTELAERAEQLSAQYIDGRARPPFLAAPRRLSTDRAGPWLPRRSGRRRPVAEPAPRARGLMRTDPERQVGGGDEALCTGFVPATSKAGISR